MCGVKGSGSARYRRSTEGLRTTSPSSGLLCGGRGDCGSRVRPVGDDPVEESPGERVVLVDHESLVPGDVYGAAAGCGAAPSGSQRFDPAHRCARVFDVVEEEQSAAGAEDAAHFVECGGLPGDFAQGEEAHDRVEVGVGERQVAGVPFVQFDGEAGPAGCGAGLAQHAGAQVDADHLGHVGGIVGKVAAGSYGHVEDPAGCLSAQPLPGVFEDLPFQPRPVVVSGGPAVPDLSGVGDGAILAFPADLCVHCSPCGW